jgi:hypothetical protein
LNGEREPERLNGERRRRVLSFRPERLLPLACIVAAAALLVSEFMTTFQLASTGPAFCNVEAAGRHHFALGVLAIFAIVALVIAVLAASKPAAMAVGAAGLLALLLFLIIDLPHAGNSGTLAGCSATTNGQFFEAKANPQAGFWLEMVGALALALSGVALATFSAEQLASLRPRWLEGLARSGETEPAASSPALQEAGANPGPNPGGEGEAPDPPARARGARRS